MDYNYPRALCKCLGVTKSYVVIYVCRALVRHKSQLLIYVIARLILNLHMATER